MILKYDLNDAVAEAIMTQEPLVLVEAVFDEQLYQKIADTTLETQINVCQVSDFENYEAGCRGVIKAIELLQSKFAEREDNIKLVLGIIDRDIRQFRGELPNLTGLFILKYYSIETYFATRQNLKKLIHHLTNTKSQDVDENVLHFVEQEFPLENLYYLSLEALKNACIENYNGIVSYDEKELPKERQQYLISKIEAKKTELECFALSFGINKNDIKLIAKGKWYLYNFADFSWLQIKQLSDKCKNAEINQCRSCQVQNYKYCRFKLKEKSYPSKNLSQSLLNYIDEQECVDIIEALKKLG